VPRVFAPLIIAATLGTSPAPAGPGAGPGLTRVELTKGVPARAIVSCALAEGEPAVLTWRNSLFHLLVTEKFVARAGGLELSSVSFADPAGGEPPLVRPQDVDDLYHTGGAFRAEGLSRPVRHVVFRVGAVGDPTLDICGERVRFVDEVGFGGAVTLDVR